MKPIRQIGSVNACLEEPPTGRTFFPVTVYPERAEVHILDDEAAARTYISQMWAEAMTIYRSGKYKLSFSAEMNAYLKAHQQDFMQEDTQAGMISRVSYL